MARVRLSVDVEPELRRRVRIAAASRDQSVKEWIEDVLRRELDSLRREPGLLEELSRDLSRGDRDWMESDLSHLREFEPYEWEEGELEEGRPVGYEPGVGLVVEGGKEDA